MGGRMRTAIGLVVLWGLTGAAQAADCALKQYDSIDMMVASDHVSIPVLFGDNRKQMVFQLGSAMNAIPQKDAEELGLRIRSIDTGMSVNVNGHKITRRGVADTKIGRNTVEDMEFLLIPPEIPGLYNTRIGTALLSKMDFELDMAQGKLNLFSPDHCPGNVVYWTKTGFAQLPLKAQEMGFLRTEVVLDGKPITVALNTAGPSRIGMNAMRGLFGVDETSSQMIAAEPDEFGRKTYRFPFKTLTADGLTIANPAIRVYEEKPEPGCNDKLHVKFPDPPPLHSTEGAMAVRCFGGGDAILGMSVLGKLHLYFSTKEKLVYITGAGAR
jgi:hypothetical protein